MKPTYSKVIKGIMLGLIVISVAIFLLGWILGFEAKDGVAVDALFIWAYVMVGIALVSILCIGGYIGIKNDKKFLVKVVSVVGGAALVCLVVYLLSPGAPAVGIAEQPSASTLKLTDTVLNLTYLAGGVAIASILVGEVVKTVRGRKDAR